MLSDISENTDGCVLIAMLPQYSQRKSNSKLISGAIYVPQYSSISCIRSQLEKVLNEVPIGRHGIKKKKN